MPVKAQDDVKNFRKPILVVETEGHNAPVRALIWRNPFSLLSAGQDKVVKVWNLGDGARLSRTIRPMIWRGLRGMIYSMAMTPKPDARGESLLAIAGYGVVSTGGDITVYRYPGRNGEGTGEPVSRLFARDAADAGHKNSVLCMAFNPSGTLLASGGADNTAILWERAGEGFRPRATLRGHAGEIHALAYTPDGSRLITAGWLNRRQGSIDGTLRAWDVATGAQVDMFPGTNPPSGINTLSIHPDGNSLVIGRENGSLLRLDLRNLAQVAPVALATLPGQGPVEHVSFSPDGTKLSVSLIADRTAMIEPKTVACDVEIRDMPLGTLSHRHGAIPGLVYATSFSPDGNKLAYAGGHAQTLFIRDIRNPQNPPIELKGQGTTILSVGFTADSQTIGFARETPAAAQGPGEGFDLKARVYRAVEPNELRGAILEHEGWTLRVTTRPSYHLESVNADGRISTFAVNSAREGNIWSYTILPGHAERGHPRPTVAIGTEAGVIVFDLATGSRLRMFSGHSAPVTALAPSPDGRWLASGSVDQTIRVYPLTGCDKLPGFGAVFRREADSSWIIDRIEAGGFAAAMGLLAGDRIVKGQIIDRSGIRAYEKPEELADLTRQVDSVLPNDEIGLFVRRNVWIPGLGHFAINLPPLPSSKRNNPAFNLLVGLDKEWVLWTPRGYYDTSIEGDSRLLGWQINPPFDGVPPRPTDYLPIASFAAKLIRGDILDQVWETAGKPGEPNQAVAVVQPQAPDANPPAPPPPTTERQPEKIVVEEQPPRIEFSSAVAGTPLPAPGDTWSLSVPKSRLKVQISAVGGSKVKERQVVIDDRLATAKLASPSHSVGEEFDVPLIPNRPVRVSVNATSDTDTPRSAWIDILYTPPPQAAPPAEPIRQARLIMLGIGIDEFPNQGLPKLVFAPNDTQRLAEFLPQHLVAPSGGFRNPTSSQDRISLIGSAASAKGIMDAFEHLRDQLQRKQIAAGDLVVVFMESHVLELSGKDGAKSIFIAPADLGEGNPPSPPLLSTRELSERLGELSNAGCRVVLFLDGVHLPSSGKGTLKSNIKPWIRELQKDRRVITFIASKNGPSRRSETERHGLFTLGILQAFRGSQTAAKAGEPWSIEAFKTAVVEEVRNLSNRYQEVGLYLPNSVPPRTLFARP